ncbi:hypothetical protein NXF25_002247 [Crotalus adamanteus]|uniref:Protein FAM161A-like n=1 Tax=Crotalus adamanteus TaxID=8729 RepID=A0AAW1CBC6_CROAD
MPLTWEKTGEVSEQTKNSRKHCTKETRFYTRVEGSCPVRDAVAQRLAGSGRGLLSFEKPMDASHRAALLTASCLHTPVNPRTKAPAALYERVSERASLEDGVGQVPSVAFSDHESLTPGRDYSSIMCTDCKDWLDLSNMYLSNQEYYLKLEELKNAHLETMAKLEEMYQNKLFLKDVQPLTDTDMIYCKTYRSAWETKPFQLQNMHRSITASTRKRLEAIRKHEKQRMKEYLQELEEIEERVEKRPLLLEQATQKNARLAAEKHYSDLLRELGLCEDFISKKGQTVTEEFLQDSYSNSFENLAANVESDNEHEEKRESEEDISQFQSAQHSGEEEEKEDEKEEEKEKEDEGAATQSDHADQETPEHESENDYKDSVEKSSDYEG